MSEDEARGRRGRGWAAALGLTLTVAIFVTFVVFVWPTRWRAFAVVPGRAPILAARQDRLTGRVEILTPKGGWLALPLGRAPVAQAGTTGTAGPAIESIETVDPLAGYTPGWETTAARPR